MNFNAFYLIEPECFITSVCNQHNKLFIKCFTFFLFTKCSKSSVYFTLTAHLNSEQAPFKCHGAYGL